MDSTTARTITTKLELLGATVAGLGVIIALSVSNVAPYALIQDAAKRCRVVPFAELKRGSITPAPVVPEYEEKLELVSYGTWDRVLILSRPVTFAEVAPVVAVAEVAPVEAPALTPGQQAARRRLLAAIHATARDLGLKGTAYRATLERLTGHRSCKHMSLPELAKVKGFLNEARPALLTLPAAPVAGGYARAA